MKDRFIKVSDVEAFIQSRIESTQALSSQYIDNQAVKRIFDVKADSLMLLKESFLEYVQLRLIETKENL